MFSTQSIYKKKKKLLSFANIALTELAVIQKNSSFTISIYAPESSVF